VAAPPHARARARVRAISLRAATRKERAEQWRSLIAASRPHESPDTLVYRGWANVISRMRGEEDAALATQSGTR
jgi:hypothetical protein